MALMGRALQLVRSIPADLAGRLLHLHPGARWVPAVRVYRADRATQPAQMGLTVPTDPWVRRALDLPILLMGLWVPGPHLDR